MNFIWKNFKSLNKFSAFIKLKRMEETENEYECTFMLELRSNKNLENLKKN